MGHIRSVSDRAHMAWQRNRWIGIVLLVVGALPCCPVHADTGLPLDAWRVQAAQTRLLAESDAPGAYRVARQLQAAMPSGTTPADQDLILNLLARTEIYLALTEEGARHARLALEQAARQADRIGQLEAELNLALISIYQGNIDATVSAAIHSQALLEGVNRPDLLGESMFQMTIAYRRLGQLDESISTAVRAMEMAQRSKDQLFLAYAHDGLGLSFAQSNRYKEAQEHFLKMRNYARTARSQLLESSALSRLAQAKTDLGDLRGGEAIQRESLEICRSIGNPFCVYSALFGLAENLRKQGRIAETLPLLNEAVAGYDQHPSKIPLWWVLNGRSQSYQALGRSAESRADAERAHALAREINFPLYLNESAKRLSALHAEKKNFARAYEYLQEALDTETSNAREALSARTVALAKHYESESKQRQIDELTLRNRQQQDEIEKRWLWTVLFGSFALLAGAAYFVFRLRRSRQEISLLNAHLEQRVEERTVELHQREQEYRTLAENSPNFIIRYDTDCRHTYMNPAFKQLTGLGSPELLGKTPENSSRLMNAQQYQDNVIHVLTSGQGQQVEFSAQTTDGHERWGNIHLVPEFDKKGQVVSVLGIGYDVTERKQRELQEEIRRSIFELLAHGGDLAEILALVVKYAEILCSDLLCSILLLNESRDRILLASAPSLPPDYGEAIRRDVNLSATEDAMPLAHALEAALIKDPWLPDQFGLEALYLEPIVDAKGETLGAIVIYRRKTRNPVCVDSALIRQSSHLAAIAIERKRIEEKMRHQASYDDLTGLPNRRLFSDRLSEEIARAARARKDVGLLFIDLDRFKEVNDSLGHDIGDTLLIKASDRIRRCVRESDTVARLGGDEFVVVIPEASEPHLGRIAQALVDTLALPFTVDKHTAYVSASIGIATYPTDADNVEALLGCADQAMYAAKETGRNGFSFFTAIMQERMQQRVRLANDLRDALTLGQLHTYFQPIVDTATGKVVKAEALLRWQHPQQGMVSPELFIPIAEDTGSIHEIGDWVFRQSAAMAQRWRSLLQTDAAESVQISVNVSPRQFVRNTLGDSWIELLGATGLPSKCMVIEITEGLLLGDQADVMVKLGKFRDAGMEIALDDFGTGYSAMAYLKKFNIDYLKIDRSFVRDLETDPSDKAIAEAIVAMAHKLDLKVIAEGVETQEQRALLAAVGCEYIQGYLYAQPMPADEFLEYVRKADGASDGMLSAST